MIRGSIPARVRSFFLSSTSRLWDPPSLLFDGYRGWFTRDKEAGAWSCQSHVVSPYPYTYHSDHPVRLINECDTALWNTSVHAIRQFLKTGTWMQVTSNEQTSRLLYRHSYCHLKIRRLHFKTSNVFYTAWSTFVTQ
jgi:hypothetical protein